MQTAGPERQRSRLRNGYETFRARRHSTLEVWSVRAIALLSGMMGAVNVMSAVTPGLMGRLAVLRQVLPLSVRRGGHLTAALAGFALLLLAGNLWRRKRVAWLLTLIALAVSVVSQLLKGLYYEEAILAGALAAALWLLRSSFHARSDAPSAWQGLRALLAALAFTLAYGALGFFVLDRHFRTPFSLDAALVQTVVMFTEFYDPGLEPITGFGRYFAASIYGVGGATLAYALFMLLRPVLMRWPATVAERERARRIVEAHGQSLLARFTLFDDKSYCFTPGGSVVAFVVKGGVALALGDPIGPPGDVDAAIAEFRGMCGRNDWQPAFYQTSPDTLEPFKRAGLDSLCLGHEAIVDLTGFTLEGSANKPLRNAVSKMVRLGHCAEVAEPPLPDRLISELREVSDEWLTSVRGVEMRFSLGWFEDEYVRNSRVMTVRTPEGVVSAFANVVPEYQRNAISLDLMRQRRETASGTMDFLFVSLFQWARAQGYCAFNLGLSALAGVGQHSDDPAAERALCYIYEHIDQFYNFKGLYSFKEKFHPEWSPRYLIYPGPAQLPAVALALMRADSGEDFLWTYAREWAGKRLEMMRI